MSFGPEIYLILYSSIENLKIDMLAVISMLKILFSLSIIVLSFLKRWEKTFQLEIQFEQLEIGEKVKWM